VALVDAVIVVRAGPKPAPRPPARARSARHAGSVARLQPDPAAAAALAGRASLAFLGLAHPQKLLPHCCGSAGPSSEGPKPFADHHPYFGAA
jgi:tetraacyldisaccharide 4'-kinase